MKDYVESKAEINQFLYVRETVEEILPAIRLSVIQEDYEELQSLWSTFKESLHVLAKQGLENLVSDIEESMKNGERNIPEDKVFRFCSAVEESLSIMSNKNNNI